MAVARKAAGIGLADHKEIAAHMAVAVHKAVVRMEVAVHKVAARMAAAVDRMEVAAPHKAVDRHSDPGRLIAAAHYPGFAAVPVEPQPNRKKGKRMLRLLYPHRNFGIFLFP